MTVDLWKELHVNALRSNGTTDSVFLSNFRQKLLRITGECGCRNFWDTWTRENPPIYSPREAYFEWTVRVHNAVNQKLNKPIITTEDALDMFIPLI
jgi:hypothetical protein